MMAGQTDADATVTVAVRVPRDGGGDLATCASRRLERGPGIDAVDVLALDGLEPALAATVVTVEVAVRTADDPDSATLAERLAAAPGAERVDEISR